MGKVVSRETAVFDGYDPISLYADHANMVRFASANDVGFQRVAKEMSRWEEEIRAEGDSHSISAAAPSKYPMKDSNNTASIKSGAQNKDRGTSPIDLVDMAANVFDLPEINRRVISLQP